MLKLIQNMCEITCYVSKIGLFEKLKTRKNKKGENFFSPFLPQIYHKLNLLMLW